MSPASNLMYDNNEAVEPAKDYIVVAKNDACQGAWSRANHWVNISTINKLRTLLPTYDFTEILNTTRQAMRPIIEYEAGMHMWDSATYVDKATAETLARGTVDYAVTTGNEPTTPGDTYVYIDNNNDSRLWTVGATPPDVTLVNNTTFSILNSVDGRWKNADAFVEHGITKLAQQKTKINQYPEYRFYNSSGTPLEDVDGIAFKGEVLFGYKEGTGTVIDTELGKVLSFKDTPKGAEYEFENVLLTKKYLNSYKHIENDNLTHTKKQTGYTSFKQHGILKSIYTPVNKSAGAFEHVQYEITAADTALTIPYGKNNWRPTQEYFVHEDRLNYAGPNMHTGRLAITTKHSDGTTTTARAGSQDVYMIGVNQTFTLHHLATGNITISSQPEITKNTVGATTTITTSAASDNKQFNVLINGKVLQTFLISSKWDGLFHKTTVNGVDVLASNKTISNTSVLVDDSILAVGDIVDFYWNNNSITNKTTNTSLPDILLHNVHNTPIGTFTLSETLAHWSSKLNTLPGFDGNTFSENNFASVPNTSSYGGTIFMSDDISIMHDLNYSDNKLSLTGALNEQANEFVSFRDRVAAQAGRIWATNPSATVQELTNKSIQQVVRNKGESKLYKDSNMLFTQTDNKHVFITKNNTTTAFKTMYTFNGDLNIRDHVYVYQTVSSIRTLLTKDKDYSILGDTVTLTTAPISNATIEIYYSQMDEGCFIPPSMVKLGLAHGHMPTVHTWTTQDSVSKKTLYTHDGTEIDVTTSTLDNTTVDTFDPVNAVIYEMEKRIYAGLVKEDSMYTELNVNTAREKYNSPVTFIPANHTSSWFAINDLNNYLEKYYYQWAKRKSITSLNVTGLYNAADDATWNYSTINTYEDFGTTLPGHYKGAYTHLFGTHTPDITPWHMLGFGFKPSWWDDHYSWTNLTKRTALINALTKGIVSKPDPALDTVVVDINYARHNWDWSTRCPVKIDGALESIKVVLDPNSNVSNAAKEADFVFGDWGPVEFNWRASALGQAMLVDAITKLVPAKAWTEFFQPGATSKYTSVVANADHYTSELPSSANYKMPGVVYDKSVYSIKVTGTSPPTTVEKNAYFNVLDDYGSTLAKATWALTDPLALTGTISSISIIERGLNFTGTPVISYVGTPGAADDMCVEIELKAVPFVANGLAQAQYNYLVRNQQNISQTELYSNATTKLQEKLSGFTSKHLLDISAESSLTGDFILGENDFNIEMYKGAVTDSLTASAVLITKTLTGWKVSGLSNNNREFKFFEPNLANTTSYTTQTIANQQVRRYDNFVATASIAEYDSIFQRVQDTYNFIRGYWEWMRTSGYTLAYDGDSSAFDFVTWALTAEVGNVYILQLGREIKFKPSHGHVYEYNQLEYNGNDVLDNDSNRLQTNDLSVSRTDGTVNIVTKNKEFIGSITSAVLDYEHIVIFENKTKLGMHLFDDVMNRRQHRLLVKGQRTSNWTGEKKAPGYLIVDNHIVQNFDSAVQSVDDIYRTDVNEFNKAFSKAKDLTIGNVEGQLLDGLGIDHNVLTNYYQGVIKEKGTKGAIQHIGKSRILNGDKTTVSAFEQYMFRQSELGNSDFEDALEIEVLSTDINSSPQTISLSAAPTSPASNIIYKTANRTVNDKDVVFATTEYANSVTDILTGGEALNNETKYQIATPSDISTAYDSTAAYAKIPTWNNYTSYKKGEQVRYQGQLWNCDVDFTGLTLASTVIRVEGLLPNPTFAPSTIATIAGVPATFAETTRTYDTDVVTGTVASPTFMPSVPLIINGVTIPFAKTTAADVIPFDSTPFLLGSLQNFSLNPVTNESIIITTGGTSTPINFDTTPANVVENFTGLDSGVTPANVVENVAGVAAQQTYTIAQALSGATYSVASVTIDGTANTDFTVSGQNITFATPTFAGSEAIVITLAHATVVDLQDTFIIAQALTGSTYSVGTVTINGTATSAYTVSGQDITFTSAPADSAAIVITLTHIPHQMTSDEIVTHINSYNITGFVATKTADNRLRLDWTTTVKTEALTLSTSTTNSQLGFLDAGESDLSNVTQETVEALLTIDNIVAGINAESNSALTSITASKNGSNQLVLTKTNGLSNTNIVITGGARTAIGMLGDNTLDGIYDNSSDFTDIPRRSNAAEAVASINAALTAANVTTVSAAVEGNQLVITSTDATLTMGSSSFNTQAGLETGTITSVGSNVANVWNIIDAGTNTNQFSLASIDDALYNILVTNDSDFTIASSGIVVTKFNGWNILQVQENATPLYTMNDPDILTEPTTTCGICAGTKTSDGNDAEVTTNIAHGLAVGDYVQLLNTTTTPNIDGIHKITKLGTGAGGSKVFYIDEYIEKCGNAVSVNPLVTTRFANETQRDAAVALARWNLPLSTLVIASSNNSIPGTYVYKSAAANTWTAIRETTHRPTNDNIDSIVIYSHKNNRAKVQLEVWDPIRKIIPGIAQQNLDYTNVSDNAIYTTSTDANQFTDNDTAWSIDQVGTRWWDTSKVRYYDYDQGDTAYRSTHWGMLYPNSEVVVWEWIKSSVAPDDYADAVNNSTEMYGVVATGAAFSVYDSAAEEDLYYYTIDTEWNNRTTSYNNVYYFWVKNKTTISDTRTLSAFDVANIIKDPSASGVSWFAALNANEFIIDNIKYYVEDTSTVLQINVKGDKYKSHNEWTLITKDSDLIPEYYINQMKYSLAGRNSDSNRLPFITLHNFNRYGDDIASGQTWFNDLSAARRNAVVTINKLLQHINLDRIYKNTWDRTFKLAGLPSNVWTWYDYKLESYSGTINDTITVSKYTELTNIDRNRHLVAKINVFDIDLQLDRSETYAYNSATANWELVLKRNTTIQLNEELLTFEGGYDIAPFDSTPFDQSHLAFYWETIITGLYKDIFINYNIDNMNTLFFSMVDYTLSSFAQTNWIRKTTYITLEFNNTIDTTTRKYKKDKLSNALGYIQEVKPFHTKVSTTTEKYSHTDSTTLTLTETPQTNITMKVFDIDAAFGGTTYTAGDFTQVNPQIYSGGAFTDSYANTDTLNGVGFSSPEWFNYVTSGANRNSLVELKPVELLRINVQTNATGSTTASTSRTFAHIQDTDGTVRAYALLASNKTTLGATLSVSDAIITVASSAAFSSTGFAYINGELIEYAKDNSTTLEIIKRGVAGTFAVTGAVGNSIIDVSSAQLTFANETPAALQYNTQGNSILNSPNSIQAQELQGLGQGIEL